MSKVSDEQIKLQKVISDLNPVEILDLVGVFVFELNKIVQDFEHGLNELMKRVTAEEDNTDLPM